MSIRIKFNTKTTARAIQAVHALFGEGFVEYKGGWFKKGVGCVEVWYKKRPFRCHRAARPPTANICRGGNAISKCRKRKSVNTSDQTPALAGANTNSSNMCDLCAGGKEQKTK